MLQHLHLPVDRELPLANDTGIVCRALIEFDMYHSSDYLHAGLLLSKHFVFTEQTSWCDHVSKEGCCRHAFGDQYRATDIPIPGPGKLELVYHPQDGGEPQRFEVHNFDGKGALSARALALRLLSLQPVHSLQHPLPFTSKKHALWLHCTAVNSVAASAARLKSDIMCC